MGSSTNLRKAEDEDAISLQQSSSAFLHPHPSAYGHLPCPSYAQGWFWGPFHQLPMVSRPPPALPLWAGRRSPQHSELKANSLKQRSEGLGVELLFIMPRGHCVIYGQVWRQVGAQTWVWAQCECRDREIDSWIDEDKLLGQQGWRLESSYRCELC